MTDIATCDRVSRAIELAYEEASRYAMASFPTDAPLTLPDLMLVLLAFSERMKELIEPSPEELRDGRREGKFL